jgi:hypothetical protein
MTTEEAKNRGFIARMNKKDRVPIHDKKFYDELISQHTSGLKKYLESWLNGWDQAQTEYLKSTRQ